ncbi:MAG: ABC-F family ATP-binding cassette domain-containing protein [Halanaerobiales bacterium]|nr:ABC-F family ATP-binding cassette domain-containing protein [Halanaerobiales bacterium]
MSLLILDRLNKNYAGQEIFQNLSCTITKGQRIGLVGPNGTGKSTLLKILAGLEDYSKGRLISASKIQIGYLEQDPTFSPTITLYQEMLQIFEKAITLEKKMRQLEVQMNSTEASNPDCIEEYVTQYGKLQEAFELANGYSYDHKIRSILFGLNFTEQDLDQEMITFSGGERIRAAVAKLLLLEPDLLLLDEPTNHLDLAAIEWLESHLATYPGTILMVSHDRIFLDQVVNQIYEMGLYGVEIYRGNYSYYQNEKKKRLSIQYKRYQHQQEEIARMERFISRFKAGTRSTQAKSVEKRLAKLERIEKPQGSNKTMHLPFGQISPIGHLILECSGVSKSFSDDTPLFANLDLTIEQRERLVITGPNGSGKSTLLKMIAGELKPDTGELRFDPRVKIGYFSQHFERLDLELSIYENIYRARPMDRFQIYSLAGAFLFSGEDVEKPANVLSGGEKNRLALACLIAEQPNLLLLDEPTNHLDLSSRDVLVNALKDFPGTIIFISHDRYLIQQIATRELRFPLC